MLDFHYSDFWADWKQQKIPNDWENLEAFEIEKWFMNIQNMS